MLNYYKELVYYVQRMIGDKEHAKDVIQEAYARVIEVDSRTQITNKRAYLYKMARNIVIDESRKNKNISKIEYEEEKSFIPTEQQPEEIVYETNRHEVLMQIVQTLPSRSKQAFIFHVIEGYTRKEIAEKMGISVNTVEKHITYATLKIKNQIENS